MTTPSEIGSSAFVCYVNGLKPLKPKDPTPELKGDSPAPEDLPPKPVDPPPKPVDPPPLPENPLPKLSDPPLTPRGSRGSKLVGTPPSEEKIEADEGSKKPSENSKASTHGSLKFGGPETKVNTDAGPGNHKPEEKLVNNGVAQTQAQFNPQNYPRMTAVYFHNNDDLGQAKGLGYKPEQAEPHHGPGVTPEIEKLYSPCSLLSEFKYSTWADTIVSLRNHNVVQDIRDPGHRDSQTGRRESQGSLTDALLGKRRSSDLLLTDPLTGKRRSSDLLLTDPRTGKKRSSDLPLISPLTGRKRSSGQSLSSLTGARGGKIQQAVAEFSAPPPPSSAGSGKHSTRPEGWDSDRYTPQATGIDGRTGTPLFYNPNAAPPSHRAKDNFLRDATPGSTHSAPHHDENLNARGARYGYQGPTSGSTHTAPYHDQNPYARGAGYGYPGPGPTPGSTHTASHHDQNPNAMGAGYEYPGQQSYYPGHQSYHPGQQSYYTTPSPQPTANSSQAAHFSQYGYPYGSPYNYAQPSYAPYMSPGYGASPIHQVPNVPNNAMGPAYPSQYYGETFVSAPIGQPSFYEAMPGMYAIYAPPMMHYMNPGQNAGGYYPNEPSAYTAPPPTRAPMKLTPKEENYKEQDEFEVLPAIREITYRTTGGKKYADYHFYWPGKPGKKEQTIEVELGQALPGADKDGSPQKSPSSEVTIKYSTHKGRKLAAYHFKYNGKEKHTFVVNLGDEKNPREALRHIEIGRDPLSGSSAKQKASDSYIDIGVAPQVDLAEQTSSVLGSLSKQKEPQSHEASDVPPQVALVAQARVMMPTDQQPTNYSAVVGTDEIPQKQVSPDVKITHNTRKGQKYATYHFAQPGKKPKTFTVETDPQHSPGTKHKTPKVSVTYRQDRDILYAVYKFKQPDKPAETVEVQLGHHSSPLIAPVHWQADEDSSHKSIPKKKDSLQSLPFEGNTNADMMDDFAPLPETVNARNSPLEEASNNLYESQPHSHCFKNVATAMRFLGGIPKHPQSSDEGPFPSEGECITQESNKLAEPEITNQRDTRVPVAESSGSQTSGFKKKGNATQFIAQLDQAPLIDLQQAEIESYPIQESVTEPSQSHGHRFSNIATAMRFLSHIAEHPEARAEADSFSEEEFPAAKGNELAETEVSDKLGALDHSAPGSRGSQLPIFKQAVRPAQLLHQHREPSLTEPLQSQLGSYLEHISVSEHTQAHSPHSENAASVMGFMSALSSIPETNDEGGYLSEEECAGEQRYSDRHPTSQATKAGTDETQPQQTSPDVRITYDVRDGRKYATYNFIHPGRTPRTFTVSTIPHLSKKKKREIPEVSVTYHQKGDIVYATYQFKKRGQPKNTVEVELGHHSSPLIAPVHWQVGKDSPRGSTPKEDWSQSHPFDTAANADLMEGLAPLPEVGNAKNSPLEGASNNLQEAQPNGHRFKNMATAMRFLGGIPKHLQASDTRNFPSEGACRTEKSDNVAGAKIIAHHGTRVLPVAERSASPQLSRFKKEVSAAQFAAQLGQVPPIETQQTEIKSYPLHESVPEPPLPHGHLFRDTVGIAQHPEASKKGDSPSEEESTVEGSNNLVRAEISNQSDTSDPSVASGSSGSQLSAFRKAVTAAQFVAQLGQSILPERQQSYESYPLHDSVPEPPQSHSLEYYQQDDSPLELEHSPEEEQRHLDVEWHSVTNPQSPALEVVTFPRDSYPFPCQPYNYDPSHSMVSDQSAVTRSAGSQQLHFRRPYMTAHQMSRLRQLPLIKPRLSKIKIRDFQEPQTFKRRKLSMKMRGGNDQESQSDTFRTIRLLSGITKLPEAFDDVIFSSEEECSTGDISESTDQPGTSNLIYPQSPRSKKCQESSSTAGSRTRRQLSFSDPQTQLHQLTIRQTEELRRPPDPLGKQTQSGKDSSLQFGSIAELPEYYEEENSFFEMEDLLEELRRKEEQRQLEAEWNSLTIYESPLLEAVPVVTGIHYFKDAVDATRILNHIPKSPETVDEVVTLPITECAAAENINITDSRIADQLDTCEPSIAERRRSQLSTFKKAARAAQFMAQLHQPSLTEPQNTEVEGYPIRESLPEPSEPHSHSFKNTAIAIGGFAKGPHAIVEDNFPFENELTEGSNDFAEPDITDQLDTSEPSIAEKRRSQLPTFRKAARAAQFMAQLRQPPLTEPQKTEVEGYPIHESLPEPSEPYSRNFKNVTIAIGGFSKYPHPIVEDYFPFEDKLAVGSSDFAETEITDQLDTSEPSIAEKRRSQLPTFRKAARAAQFMAQLRQPPLMTEPQKTEVEGYPIHESLPEPSEPYSRNFKNVTIAIGGFSKYPHPIVEDNFPFEDELTEGSNDIAETEITDQLGTYLSIAEKSRSQFPTFRKAARAAQIVAQLYQPLQTEPQLPKVGTIPWHQSLPGPIEPLSQSFKNGTTAMGFSGSLDEGPSTIDEAVTPTIDECTAEEILDWNENASQPNTSEPSIADSSGSQLSAFRKAVRAAQFVAQLRRPPATEPHPLELEIDSLPESVPKLTQSGLSEDASNTPTLWGDSAQPLGDDEQVDFSAEVECPVEDTDNHRGVQLFDAKFDIESSDMLKKEAAGAVVNDKFVIPTALSEFPPRGTREQQGKASHLVTSSSNARPPNHAQQKHSSNAESKSSRDSIDADCGSGAISTSSSLSQVIPIPIHPPSTGTGAATSRPSIANSKPIASQPVGSTIRPSLFSINHQVSGNGDSNGHTAAASATTSNQPDRSSIEKSSKRRDSMESGVSIHTDEFRASSSRSLLSVGGSGRPVENKKQVKKRKEPRRMGSPRELTQHDAKKRARGKYERTPFNPDRYRKNTAFVFHEFNDLMLGRGVGYTPEHAVPQGGPGVTPELEKLYGRCVVREMTKYKTWADEIVPFKIENIVEGLNQVLLLLMKLAASSPIEHEEAFLAVAFLSNIRNDLGEYPPNILALMEHIDYVTRNDGSPPAKKATIHISPSRLMKI